MQRSTQAVRVALSGGNKMKKRLKIMCFSIVIALAGSVGATSLGFLEHPIIEILNLLGIDLEEYEYEGGTRIK
tara:strand:- start:2237 stop:2455 length:219 start_codon:yes stop_codon:yes gene_type:complete